MMNNAHLSAEKASYVCCTKDLLTHAYTLLSTDYQQPADGEERRFTLDKLLKAVAKLRGEGKKIMSARALLSLEQQGSSECIVFKF